MSHFLKYNKIRWNPDFFSTQSEFELKETFKKDSLNEKKFPKCFVFFSNPTQRHIREFGVKIKGGKQYLRVGFMTSIQMTKTQRYVEKSNFETANGSKITIYVGKQVKKSQTCFYLDWIWRETDSKDELLKWLPFFSSKLFSNIRTLWKQNSVSLPWLNYEPNLWVRIMKWLNWAMALWNIGSLYYDKNHQQNKKVFKL